MDCFVSTEFWYLKKNLAQKIIAKNVSKILKNSDFWQYLPYLATLATGCISVIQRRAEGRGERGDGPGHPRQGVSKE